MIYDGSLRSAWSAARRATFDAELLVLRIKKKPLSADARRSGRGVTSSSCAHPSSAAARNNISTEIEYNTKSARVKRLMLQTHDRRARLWPFHIYSVSLFLFFSTEIFFFSSSSFSFRIVVCHISCRRPGHTLRITRSLTSSAAALSGFVDFTRSGSAKHEPRAPPPPPDHRR